MKRMHNILILKFFVLYFSITIFGISILTLSNIYVLGLKMEALLKFNIGAVILEGFVGTIILQGITMRYLKNVSRMLKGFSDSESDYHKAWDEMVSFPSRIFWGMVIFGIAASVFHHTADILYNGQQLNRTLYIELIFALLTEQTLSLILAVLFFTGARRLLRPYILNIPYIKITDFQQASFTNNLLVIFCCLLFITGLSLLSYILASILDSRAPSIASLFFIILFDICFAVAIYLLTVRELKNDFGVLVEVMASLLKGSRVQLKARVPIVTKDEIGSLGLIFNKLQEKISKEYDEIQAELQLACSIQQKLLPEGEKTFGPYSAAGICRPCRDVGGDFFDIIPLDGGRFTLIIGDVIGKGTPAALIMSAVLLLFRNEIRQGGTPKEVLKRLNRVVIELGISDLCLTAGVAVFNTGDNVLQYASAGHVAPYVLKKSGLSQLPCSSLPIGISLEESYDQLEYYVEENDKLIFYTDGIIDAFDKGTASGFDDFERILCAADGTLSLAKQINSIIENTEHNEKSRYEDDRTLVIVQRNVN